MPIPLLQSLWRKLFGNRRRVPRFRPQSAELTAASISLHDCVLPEEPAPGSSPLLVGSIRDLSEEGLSLIFPSDMIMGRQITDENCTLLIVLSLPRNSVSMRAAAVYSRLVNEHSPEKGYIIGVRITEMSDDHRSRLTEYLQTMA